MKSEICFLVFHIPVFVFRFIISSDISILLISPLEEFFISDTVIFTSSISIGSFL